MSLASLGAGYDGTRVSVSGGAVSSSGIVPGTPAVLAAAAKVPLEQYSLARMLASEGYGGGRGAARLYPYVAMAQTAKRYAAMRGKSITALLTAATKAGAGRYGRQNSVEGGVRWAATTNEPTLFELAIAGEVLAGVIPDISAGATKYLAPDAFKGGVQAGMKLSPFATVMEKWHGEGNAWCGHLDGINSYRLAFFRPEASQFAREESLSQILAVYGAGKSGSLLGQVASGIVDTVADVVEGGNPKTTIIVAGIGLATVGVTAYYW